MPLLWAFAVAEALATTRRHFAGVDPQGAAPRGRARAQVEGPAVATSPPHEKQELRRLVGEMDLWQLSKDLAAVASPVGMPGHRKKHADVSLSPMGRVAFVSGGSRGIGRAIARGAGAGRPHASRSATSARPSRSATAASRCCAT